MDRKNIKSAVRILTLRKLKAQAEATRLQSGVTAGSTLRERLLQAPPQQPYADLTTAYIQRTVGILDKGLAVLRQQQSTVLATINQADRAIAIVEDKLTQSNDALERSNLEALVWSSFDNSGGSTR